VQRTSLRFARSPLTLRLGAGARLPSSFVRVLTTTLASPRPTISRHRSSILCRPRSPLPCRPAPRSSTPPTRAFAPFHASSLLPPVSSAAAFSVSPRGRSATSLPSCLLLGLQAVGTDQVS